MAMTTVDDEDDEHDDDDNRTHQCDCRRLRARKHVSTATVRSVSAHARASMGAYVQDKLGWADVPAHASILRTNTI